MTALLATLGSLIFLCPGIVVYTLSLSLTLTTISNTFITATLYSSAIALAMSAIQLISATFEIDYDLSKLSEQESKDRENEANDNFMLASIGFNLSFIANLLNGFVEKKQEISNKIEKTNEDNLFEKFKEYYKTGSYLNENYDCSEIAEDLYKLSDGEGNILRIELKSKRMNLFLFENGIIQGKYEYHEIFVDKIYVYDPRYKEFPILKDEYFNYLNRINPEEFVVFTIK